LVARRARLAPRSHIIVRLAVQGTNLGDYGGIPATGKKVDFRHVTVCRLQSGLIVEQWGLSDNLSLSTQPGLVDAPRIG
jgi:predicted ester cyclase